MTYLFAKLGFTMLFCAFIASFLRFDIVLVLFCTALSGGLCFFIFPKRYRKFSSLFLAAAVAFGIMGYELYTDFYPSSALGGMKAEIIGKVTDVSSDGGKPVYTVKTESIGIAGAPQEITLKLSGWDESFALPYDIITCKVTFLSHSDGDFSDVISDRSGGISVYAYTETPVSVIGKDEKSFGYFLHNIREKISSVIYEYYIDWHAPFMEQILIGTRGKLDYSVTSSFRSSGMSHILAISGMHMVIIINLFEKLFGYKNPGRKSEKAKSAILIVIVVAYMFIGGLGMSVLRSGIMLAAQYSARLLFSRSKPEDNLGIAIITVLFINPMAACDAGFLMSVFSAAAILVFSSPLKAFIIKILHIKSNPIFMFFTEAFSVSFIAFLAVLPVSSILFGEVSLVSPFTNLLSGFFVQYSIIFGLLTVIFALVPFLGFFAGGAAVITMLCNGILLKISDFFGTLSFATAKTENPWVYIWILGSVFLIILPALFSKSFRYIPLSLSMSVFVLLAGIFCDSVFYSGVAEIKITALEQGTAVSCYYDGNDVLIAHSLGEYDKYALSEDYDVIISLDAKSGGTELWLLNNSKAGLALVSEDAAKRSSAKTVSEGKVTLWDDAFVEIISSGVFAADFGETYILYISEECDIMDIEPKFRRADIIIFDGVSPDRFPELRCEYLILRQMSGYYSGASKVITLKNGEKTFFAYDRNITEGGLFR